MSSILNIKEKIDELKKEDNELYRILNNIFHISEATGSMKIPPTYFKRVVQIFGKKDDNGDVIESQEEVLNRIETQKVIKTYNKWTGSGSLFNSLRASRPGMKNEEIADIRKKLDEYIKTSEKSCEFCYPEMNTPEDVFGRVKGKHCITGSNLAKYDAWSSVIFFRQHNPLVFSAEEVSDYIETGFKWFKKVHNYDKQFKFPFFLWNCLQKAGASQIHSHAQILMTNEIHYAKPHFLRKITKEYMQLTGRNYFNDLYKVHKALGLTLNGDLKAFTSITPLKEKEFIIISPDNPAQSDAVKETIYKVLRCYIDQLGVTSFNMAISCPAFDESSFPYIVHIVDRGNIYKPTVDMGSMELYGSSVISDDPYNIINLLNEYISNH